RRRPLAWRRPTAGCARVAIARGRLPVAPGGHSPFPGFEPGDPGAGRESGRSTAGSEVILQGPGQGAHGGIAVADPPGHRLEADRLEPGVEPGAVRRGWPRVGEHD